MPGGARRSGLRWLRAPLPPLVRLPLPPLSRPPSRPPRLRSPLPLSPLPGVPPASPPAGVPPASSLGSVRAPVALAFGRPVGVRSLAAVGSLALVAPALRTLRPALWAPPVPALLPGGLIGTLSARLQYWEPCTQSY